MSQTLRIATVSALWLQVAASFGLSLFLANRATHFGQWITLSELLLSTILLVWWTLIFQRILNNSIPMLHSVQLKTWEKGKFKEAAVKKISVMIRSGYWRALHFFYPVLTSLRVCIWLLVMLTIFKSQVHFLVSGALMFIWIGAIICSHKVNGTLSILALFPKNKAARFFLARWLNGSAAFSFGMLILNNVPIPHFSETPDQTTQAFYLAVNGLDVIATFLAYQCMRFLSPPNDP